MRVNNLLKDASKKCLRRDLNLRPADPVTDTLTSQPPRHRSGTGCHVDSFEFLIRILSLLILTTVCVLVSGFAFTFAGRILWPQWSRQVRSIRPSKRLHFGCARSQSESLVGKGVT